MVITVEYADDGPMRLVTDPSERCEGDMVATRERLHVSDAEGITWEPRVLSGRTGLMRTPRGVASTESVTESRYGRPRTTDTSDSRSWVQFNTYDLLGRYTLATAEELVGAVSVTIDGVLSYARSDGGALTRVSSLGTADDSGFAEQLDRIDSGVAAAHDATGMQAAPEPTGGDAWALS